MPVGLIDRGAERRISELLRQQYFPLFEQRPVRWCFEHDGRVTDLMFLCQRNDNS